MTDLRNAVLVPLADCDNPADAANNSFVRKSDLVRFPTASLVVVNWNYGRFLGKCIDSLKAQTYRPIEIVIVDNASTDDSRDVIAKHVGDEPGIQVIHLPKNLGPLNGALIGLAHVTGEFVAFVDSDDYLFPDYVATHVQVHLALPVPVGLTSGNIFEVSQDDVLLSGGRPRFNKTRPESGNAALLDLDFSPPRVDAIDDDTYRRLSRSIYTLPSRLGSPRFFWSPGTSLFYRRAIVEAIKPELDTSSTELQFPDAYFARLCHWISGSALIHQPLSAYRIHGQNLSSPTVAGLSLGEPLSKKGIEHRRRELMRAVLEKSELIARIVTRNRYWLIFHDMANLQPRGMEKELARADVRAHFIKALPKLIATHGARVTLNRLRAIMSFRTLLRLVNEAGIGGLSRVVYRNEFFRQAKRVVKRVR